MLAVFFLTHAYRFFFAPGGGAQWYTGNVYGNLVAIIPTGLLLFLYLRSRHLAVLAAHEELKAAHVQHSAKLDRLLDKMDTDSQGGIADVLDRLDPVTPGGLRIVADRIDTLGKSVAELHGKLDPKTVPATEGQKPLLKDKAWGGS